MYYNRPGCLGGLLRLALLRWVYGGLQRMFGFGSNSCFGCGMVGVLLTSQRQGQNFHDPFQRVDWFSASRLRRHRNIRNRLSYE